MKRFKINKAFLAALILGSTIALTQSAFTSAKPLKVKSGGTEWQFNGTSTSEMKSASEYSEVSGSGPSCDDANVLPCTINVTGDLQTYLNGHSDAQILAASDQTKD